MSKSCLFTFSDKVCGHFISHNLGSTLNAHINYIVIFHKVFVLVVKNLLNEFNSVVSANVSYGTTVSIAFTSIEFFCFTRVSIYVDSFSHTSLGGKRVIYGHKITSINRSSKQVISFCFNNFVIKYGICSHNNLPPN